MGWLRFEEFGCRTALSAVEFVSGGRYLGQTIRRRLEAIRVAGIRDAGAHEPTVEASKVRGCWYGYSSTIECRQDRTACRLYILAVGVMSRTVCRLHIMVQDRSRLHFIIIIFLNLRLFIVQ